MPLGIGDESIAEYVDIELNSYISSNDAINRLNEKSVDEIRILSFKEIPEGKAYNAMSSISAASYEIKIRDENKPEFDFEKAFYDLLDKEQVIVTKQSKKSENTLDIKPFIYEYNINGDVISLLVSCGSVMNIKPELVIKAVFDSMNKEFDEYFITIKRTEMYTGVYNEKSFKSLEDVGKDIL
jgi:radical SAM-linked protein